MACCESSSHSHHQSPHSHSVGERDYDFLAALINLPKPGHGQQHVLRRPSMDPFILQAAAASGPHVTRNHYLHDFYPHENPYQRCDVVEEKKAPRYVSKQAPRQQRLEKEGLHPPTMTAIGRRRRSSATMQQAPGELMKTLRASAESAPDPISTSPTLERNLQLPQEPPTKLPVAVTCHARTRVPTPHGNAFVHLYKNTHDNKEHLAFVIDKAQLNDEAMDSTADRSQWIRSRSLDAVWREGETEDERIVRGAYVGRLAPGHAVASQPPEASTSKAAVFPIDPLVRIHSECFTGETIGSQRCDCGEQLDEAFRLASTCPSGRGVIVYLRQEGRGIGLLEKLRAYNLQDLGHDTVTANLLLGHGADTRTYDVAGAILRDLNIDRCRLMTNNPDKIKQAEREGIRVSERVAMVPRTWRPSASASANGRRQQSKPRQRRGSPTTDEDSADENAAMMRRMGVGMIGAGNTAGPELDKYLRTKVLKMSHMIDLPSSDEQASSSTTTSDQAETTPPDVETLPTPRKLRRPRIERLANSIDSLAVATDTEGIDCGESCCASESD